MTLILDENRSRFQIKAYAPGLIQINELTLTNSVIVSATQLITDWPPQTLTELTKQHFDTIIALKPAILLLGTGTTLVFPPLELYGHLLNEGIGVEIMDTKSACSTYNVLTSEDRNVIAALIIQ
jgi:uncharacterized protein